MATYSTSQGVSPPTFNAPPPDHHLTVPGLYEYHSQHSSDHPVFTYAEAVSGKVHNITYAEAWQKIGIVANYISRHCAAIQGLANGGRPVVGIVALSDSLSYIYALVAIMALGYVAFPISHLNSVEANAHLIETTGLAALFVSEDVGTQQLARDTCFALKARGIDVRLFPMVRPEDYVHGSPCIPMKAVNVDDTDVAVIMHSSGSTALPKPIRLTKRALVNASQFPCFGDVSLAGKRIAAHTNPPCHSLGRITYTWPVSTGVTFALYAPVCPPVVPTAANYLEACQACGCDIVLCVPAFVEALGRDEVYLSVLQKLDCVAYAGAPLNRDVGRKLMASGVNLQTFWGSTDMGSVSKFYRDKVTATTGDEWEYFEFSPHLTFHMRPQPGLVQTFEPVMLVSTEKYFPHITNAEVDGTPAFAVGDLIERHPTHSQLWRVLGRKDDQIALSNGFNINPVPIEAILIQDPHILTTIVFGNSRIELGILVDPVSRADSSGDEPDAEKLKDLIWPTVESVNAGCKSYARIRREMILVASPDKPLERTPKGTAKRGICLKMYAKEIEGLYAAQVGVSPAERPFTERM